MIPNDAQEILIIPILPLLYLPNVVIIVSEGTVRILPKDDDLNEVFHTPPRKVPIWAEKIPSRATFVAITCRGMPKEKTYIEEDSIQYQEMNI